MYWSDEVDDEGTLRIDVLDWNDRCASNRGYIVSSSISVPKSNKSGDNPPHAIAKTEYERIAQNAFLCTHDHPDEDSESPEPIVFELAEDGFDYRGRGSDSGKGGSGLAGDVDAARGKSEPSQNKVGFGR